MITKAISSLSEHKYFTYLFSLFVIFALERLLIYYLGSFYFLSYSATVSQCVSGLFYDFFWCFVVITFAELIERIIALFGISLRNSIKFLAATIALILLYFLDQYYLTTGTLLNNMIFKFTFNQLVELLAFQENISLLKTLWFVLLLLGFIFFIKAPIAKSINKKYLFVFTCMIATSSFVFSMKADRADPNVYSINKSDYFLLSLLRYGQEQTKNGQVSIDEFAGLDPLYLNKKTLNPISILEKSWPDKSSIAPYFNHTTNAKAPNVCIIIVESMSANLVGNYANKTGHLMPFLDSISKQSLFFPNALSTAQRTHHVLPAVLGSLPHSRNHTTFQEIEYPSFTSLFQALKTHYYSSFYCGIDLNFNQMHRFIDYCDVDYASSSFHTLSLAEKKEVENYWGIPDGMLFREYLHTSKTQKSKSIYSKKSALDVLLTISTHEPFNYPNKDLYKKRVLQLIAKLPKSKLKEHLTSKASELGTFCYTDDKLRYLFSELRKRKEYENTIFVITGDHGSSLLYDEAMSKYRVPLMIYSPLLKNPKTIPFVVSHLDIAPTLLNYIRTTYNIPQSATHFYLGEELSITSQKPRILAFKDEYLATSALYTNGFSLQEGKLFTLDKQLNQKPSTNTAKLNELKNQLNSINKLNIYLVEQNHIYTVQQAIENKIADALLAKDLSEKPEYIKLFDVSDKDILTNNLSRDHLMIDVNFEIQDQRIVKDGDYAVWIKIGDQQGKEEYEYMQWVYQDKFEKKNINTAKVHFYLSKDKIRKIQGNQKVYCFISNIKIQDLPFKKVSWEIK